MKKIATLSAVLLMFVFHTSCGQNQPNILKENSKDETKYASAPGWIDTKYEYSDSTGKRLVIENSPPKGGPYADPNGKEYFKVIFCTRLINETDNILELKIDFSADPYAVPGLPGKYYKVLVLPDTLTVDNHALYDYGLKDLKSFLDSSIHKPSTLKRIIKPKESSGFYVVILSQTAQGALGGTLRTGLSVKGQNLFYRISLYASDAGHKLISNTEINCGSINVKNLVLQK